MEGNINNLRTALHANKFVVTVELDPPKGMNISKTVEEANLVSPKVAAVNIADSPMANMRMSPISLAHIIQRDTGVDTIFHLTCRDRNVIGLQSELLGAAALGVKNILALTGDTPDRGDHPQARGIFEINSIGLIKIAKTLNDGKDMMGNELDMATHFHIGTTVNPGAQDLEKEIDRLEQKIAAGAHFVQTQPVYDLRIMEKFMKRMESFKIPILAGILPLKSYKMAKYLAKHVPGIDIPQTILSRMKSEERQGGIDIARKFLFEIGEMTQGTHIMPVGDAKLVLQILEKF